MLDTVDKAASSSDGEFLTNPTYQIDAAVPRDRTYCEKILFWTRVIGENCSLCRLIDALVVGIYLHREGVFRTLHLGL